MKKQVLVVDDSKMYQLILKKMLEKLSMDADIVGSGKEAYETLKNHPGYDLLLMDIEMGGESGLETFIRIRKSLQLDIPAIAVTAHDTREFIKKLLAHGFKAHLKKPVDENELKEKVMMTTGRQVTDNKYAEKGEVNLETLREFAGTNEEFFRETLASILDEAQQSGQEMESYANDGEWYKLQQFAHKLYSKVAYLGMPTLHRDLDLIERYVKAGKAHADIMEVIARYQINVDEIIPQIREQYLK